MFTRRHFIKNTFIYGSMAWIASEISFCTHSDGGNIYHDKDISDFARRLTPIGRILELKDYYVWGCSPIVDTDGKIHVFFSRWNAKNGMGGWINRSEIAHAVANEPEGPYHHIETVLNPRGKDFFDGTTCHNPHIQFVNGKYCLFYIGNSNGKTDTQCIALATSASPYGPWKRPDNPLLKAGENDAWDNHCATNPSFIQHPNGQYWLYYKSWNTKEEVLYADSKIRGNRKYGLAIAEKVEGPYRKYSSNPIIDYSSLGQNRQLEDANVFIENGRFYMLARDMGCFDHQVGIILESEDGIHWSKPQISYFGVSHYIRQPTAPSYLKKYGRFERPQILLKGERPTNLFVTSQGGKYMTSSPFVFKVEI